MVTAGIGRIRILMILALFSHSMFSQSSNEEDNPSYTKTIPPPPNAASLGKYGDMPVSYYTGIPNIDIPLYEVRSGDISVPISVSYHAGGIKVEEIASWVGLGWSLNAGGVITRTVRGIADEKDLMDRTYKQNIDLYYAAPNQLAGNEILQDILDGKLDSEPDMFHFNFGGSSGKFFIGEDGVTVYTIPQQKLKISFIKNGNGGNSEHIVTWTITDERGFSYVFGKSPTNVALDGVEYNETYSACGDSQTLSETATLATSWYLVEIKSPRGYGVTFEYDNYSYNFRNLGNQTQYFCNVDDFVPDHDACVNRNTLCFTRNTVAARKLSKISFLNGSVEFETKDRFDLCGEKALEFVKVFRQGDLTPAKTFTFDYVYFVGLGKWQQPTSCVSEQEDAFYRLKLISIRETGASGEERNPYLFFYDEANQMPPRYRELGSNSADSYAQDHWGYFNGHLDNRDGSNNPTLIPTAIVNNGGYQPIEYEGANRSTVEAYAKTYVLTKIRYPTGGETSFLYESNRIPYESTSNSTELLVSVNENFPVPALISIDQEAGKSFTSSLFTIFSEIEFPGGKGAFVEIDLWDGGNDNNESTSSSEDCTTTDLAIEREIIREDGSIAYNNQSLADGAVFFLPNGKYRVKLVRKAAANCNFSNFAVNLSWIQYQKETPQGDPDHILVGGLRIKSIVDYDGIDHSDDKVRTFDFSLFDNSSKSSGSLISHPVYDWGMYYTEQHTKSEVTTHLHYFCHFLVHNSYTNYPLATTQGAFVGYKNVTVYQGDGGGSGKTQLTFTTADDYPDYQYSAYSLAPPISYEWRRGILQKEEVYANTGSPGQPFVKRKQTLNTYDELQDPLNPGVNLYANASGLKARVVTKMTEGRTFLITRFQVVTDWYAVDRVESTEYSAPEEGGKPVTNKKEYEYSLNNLQVSKSTTHSSNGEHVIEYFKYPLDYADLPASSTGQLQGLKKLQEQHIISPVIEKTITKLKAGSERVIGGQVFSYIESPLNEDIVVPESIYSLELSGVPVLVNGGTDPFAPSLVSGSNFEIDNRYTLEATLKHDNRGNLLQWQRAENITTAYVWGYDKSLPIAEAVNARSSQIFHTSFEEDGNSNEGDAKTGKFSRVGGFMMTLYLDDGQYLLTYFEKTGGIWSPQTSTISVSGGSYSLSLTGQIDEVRVYPPHAQMTTYTYDPLFGRTSATDANLITTYLNYDGLGRMKSITDDKGNVVKKLEYHYTTSTND